MKEITYKTIMENDLKKLNRWKFATVQLTAELETINAEFAAIKATNYDKMPVGSGDNTQEEKLVTAIAKKGQKEAELKLNRMRVADMERLLAKLNPTERQIIDRMVVNRENYTADRLADELGYERRELYRIKDSALMKLCQLRYGAIYQA